MNSFCMAAALNGLMRMASYGGGLKKLDGKRRWRIWKKLLEEAKELYEKRSGGRWLSRIIFGIEGMES